MFRIRRIRREKRIRRMRHIRLIRQIRPYPHLPDEILLLLFSHIPLTDLILSVGRVCTDLARVRRTELARRHTVIIFQMNKQLENYREQQNPYGSELITRVRRDDGETAWHKLEPLKQIQFNAIRIPSNLTEEHTSFLMDIMPNVTHLSVAYLQDNYTHHHPALMTLKQLTRLTNHYATSLESFSLDYDYDYDPKYYDSDDSDFSDDVPVEIEKEFTNSTIALFESINRIGPLRHLMLIGSYPELNGTLPDLSRLESFDIHRCYEHTWVDAILAAHEQGNVRVASSAQLEASQGLTFSRQLAGNFVRYHFLELFSVDNYEHLHKFCGRFTSLTTLEMTIEYQTYGDPFYPMPMAMLARCLSQLAQLIHLKLNAGIIPEEERPPQLPLAQVPSVRLLSLTICPRSHRHTQHLHIAQIFPNLQVLDLHYSATKCEECGYDCSRERSSLAEIRARNGQTVGTDTGTTNDDDVTNSSKLSGSVLYENCARQALAPLRHRANVHTVKLDLSLGNNSYVIKFLTKRAHQWRILPVDDQL